MPPCQVPPESRFGLALTEQARRCEIIVEIGTHKGLGTTRCLFNALERPTQIIYSYETEPELCQEARGHYTDDRVQIINSSVPFEGWDRIDFLLLDGSPHHSAAEFDALAPVTRIIAMDDTVGSSKNPENRKKVLDDPNWKIIYDEPDDRTGWLIAERRSLENGSA